MFRKTKQNNNTTSARKVKLLIAPRPWGKKKSSSRKNNIVFKQRFLTVNLRKFNDIKSFPNRKPLIRIFKIMKISRPVIGEQSMFHSPSSNLQEFIKVSERLRFLGHKSCALHLLSVSLGLFCSCCQWAEQPLKVTGFPNSKFVSWTDTSMITFTLL